MPIKPTEPSYREKTISVNPRGQIALVVVPTEGSSAVLTNRLQAPSDQNEPLIQFKVLKQREQHSW
jgi:hypothetical protein